MSRYERKKTDVVVKVVDMEHPCKEAYDWFVKYMPDRAEGTTGLKPSGVWGIVTLEGGVYLLSDEGVGHNVMDDDPEGFPFDLYAQHPEIEKEDGSKTRAMSIFPCVEAHCNADSLRRLPVLKEENLESFIRRFGSRLHSNYEDNREYLERVAI